MTKKPDPFMTDEENPEWTAEANAEAKPFSEVFTEQFASWKNRGGQPPVETPKVHIGFRLAADVVAGVRATGKGYNARVEGVAGGAGERATLTGVTTGTFTDKPNTARTPSASATNSAVASPHSPARSRRNGAEPIARGPMTLEEIRASRPDVDRAKVAATTKEDIRRHQIEVG
jgi:uncharacterized protein (DUF4415 family)